MKIVEIKTLNMIAPLGIDTKPYFSWKMESDQQGTMQEAYQIQVKAEKNETDCWNTGKVESEQSIFVWYQGEALKSRTVYEVTVTVWDNHGNEDTKTTTLETALLDKSDWSASWAESSLKRHKGKAGFGKQDPATMFRKTFSLKAKPIKARCYATCHGAYQLSVNGQRADQREFAPEHTVYEKYLCYQTYDVTALLNEGENALGMYVGDGWYLCPQAIPNMKMKHAHAVLFQIEVEYADGTTEKIGSDERVKVSYGPVRSSDLYAGELFDANEIQAGWDQPQFQDDAWKYVKTADYGFDNLRAQSGEPVIPVMTLSVKEVLHSPKGETILDFGQNISGRISMKVNATKSTQITLEHCEVLDKDGNYFNNIMGAGGVGKGCDQKDCYISDGTERTYEPAFTFHGFRYVKVSGIANVNPDDFKAVVLSTEKQDLGTFVTSDERINRLYENTRWSQRSNMMSIPTDCPQREKAGWTGDMLVYAKTAMLNEDCTSLFTRWLANMGCDQDKYGIIPMVVPNNGSYPQTGKMMNLMYGEKGQATSSGWGDAAVIVPYSMYEATGNTAVLGQQYDCMKRWCDYIIRKAKDKKPKRSTLPAEIEEYLWDTGYHYGEWLIPSQNKNGLDMKNLKQIMASSACYTAPIFGWNSVNHFAKIAEILGRDSDAKKYKEVADKMKQAIQKGVIREDGSMPSELMGAYVLPIYFDLVPEHLKDTFAENLVKCIEKNDGCLDTGFLGTPFLMDVLCKINRQDLAYQILWQEKAPSWLYEVNHGATTIWESWYGYDKNGNPGHLSFNHYSFGAIDDWMFRHIGGIDTDQAGFKHLIIHPHVDSAITSCSRSYETPYGKVSCEWEKTDRFTMDVTIPCNVTAEVVLPDGSSETVGSGKYVFQTLNL